MALSENYKNTLDVMIRSKNFELLYPGLEVCNVPEVQFPSMIFKYFMSHDSFPDEFKNSKFFAFLFGSKEGVWKKRLSEHIKICAVLRTLCAFLNNPRAAETV